MILQIIGTRPQYEKLIRFKDDRVVDTGQHYSNELCYDASKVDVKLSWRGILYAIRMLKYELFLCRSKVKLVVLYGDTFSTFAGALAAKQMGIKLAHIEAGTREKEDRIEKRIRIRVDKMSDYLFCASRLTYDNMNFIYPLTNYSIHKKKIYFAGDLMRDKFLKEWNSSKSDNAIMTLHRRENMNNLQEILGGVAFNYNKIIFYVHPHTRQVIKDNNIKIPNNVILKKSISYYHMVKQLRKAKVVITDSGGLIKEATWAGCYTKYIGENPWFQELDMFGDGYAEYMIKGYINKIIEDLNGKG